MRSDKTPLEQITWTAAQRLGSFNRRELAAEAEVGYETVGTWVRRWLRAGRIEALGKQHGLERFRVTDAPEPVIAAPPARQTALGNMWQTMRRLRGAFTPTDIAAHSTTDVVAVSATDAQEYCQLLVRAGYLRVMRKALPPRREAVYRLALDTGPKPPRQRRVRAVWDDNTGEYTHMPKGGDT